MIPAHEALERLRAGNLRFASGSSSHEEDWHQSRRALLTEGQEPFAVILGCSDSRVPAEIVFDQGLGDLFVIRVAGNVVASTQLGSVEFAAVALGVRLVVVLGHSGCGAVTAAVQEVREPSENPSRGWLSIGDRVRPTVERLLDTELRDDPDALMEEAVRGNVRASVRALRDGSTTIAREMDERGLAVIGAEYSLATGVVEFFE